MNQQPESAHAPHRPTEGTPHPPSRHRRLAALGVTAGLLGGGAIGLFAATPSWSSAAVVTDDTTDTEPTDIEPTDTEDRGTWLRESLQVLVDDGTLSGEQADAVADHLVTLRADIGDRPGRGGHGGPGGPGGHGGHGGFGRGLPGAVLADLLGLDAAEIRTALADGSTIAEVAASNGIDLQAVIDGLVAAANERIDQAVADGKITEDEAAERRAELVDRITEMVDTAGFGGGRGHRSGAPSDSD